MRRTQSEDVPTVPSRAARPKLFQSKSTAGDLSSITETGRSGKITRESSHVKTYMEHARQRCKMGFDQVHTELKGLLIRPLKKVDKILHRKIEKYDETHIKERPPREPLNDGVVPKRPPLKPKCSNLRHESQSNEHVPIKPDVPMRPPPNGAAKWSHAQRAQPDWPVEKKFVSMSTYGHHIKYGHQETNPSRTSDYNKPTNIGFSSITDETVLSASVDDGIYHVYDEIEDIYECVGLQSDLYVHREKSDRKNAPYEIADNDQTKPLRAVHKSVKTQLCFGLTESELENCLNACGLQRPASIFRSLAVDGLTLSSLCKLDLIDTPYSLTEEEIFDLGRLIDGWRPWL